jgi:aldose 1-epimerase
VVPRSGTPYTIVSGDARAEITGTGAGLRTLEIGGVGILDGFASDVIAPSGAGQILAPWPNRLEDGEYTFDGIRGVVPINEAGLHNAIHGLVRWIEWTPGTVAADSVTLATVIAVQPAYPWRVELAVTYAIEPSGLRVRYAATNACDRPAPFGIGFHPYFLAGTGALEGATVSCAATTHLQLDERALPIGEEPLVESRFAAMATPGGLTLDDEVLDECFTGLDRRPDGRAEVRLARGRDGRVVVLELGPTFRSLMCFTGDTLSSPRRRRAVALEPMTCPPNAFRTGVDLLVIPPGERIEDQFSITLI